MPHRRYRYRLLLGERVGERAGERVGLRVGERVGLRVGERVTLRVGDRVILPILTTPRTGKAQKNWYCWYSPLQPLRTTRNLVMY